LSSSERYPRLYADALNAGKKMKFFRMNLTGPVNAPPAAKKLIFQNVNPSPPHNF
jgi:hypothetical protein